MGQELRQLPQRDGFDYIFTDVNELDICDKEATFHFVEQNRIDLIINCAAYTDVERAEVERERAEQINVEGVANLASAAREYNATLIHISTDYVFGGIATHSPITEEQICAPLGVYGETKWRGEEAVIASGCNYIIIRTSWLYSIYGKNFVKTILKLSESKDSISVVNDQIGSPTYAADLAQTIVCLVESGKIEANGGIYHYSNKGAISWFDFAQRIVILSGNKCDVKPCTSVEFGSKVKRPSYSVLDTSKVCDRFGIDVPEWEKSLEICISKMN